MKEEEQWQAVVNFFSPTETRGPCAASPLLSVCGKKCPCVAHSRGKEKDR